MLYFNAQSTIVQAINNAGPHVSKIYVSYSKYPWNYNKDARKEFTNPSSLEILQKCDFFHLIEVIEGVWESEEEQREQVRRQAVLDGLDFLIIQDADEFYRSIDYERNIEGLYQNRTFSCFQVPWINFWKTTEYVLQYREHNGLTNTIYTTCPLFAINLSANVRFSSRRLVSPMQKHSTKQLPGVCYHLSWVYSDEDVKRKIFTWGHAHQIDGLKWYRRKWLGWNPKVRNLDPIRYVAIVKAIRFEECLPQEIQSLSNPAQQYHEIAKRERIISTFEENYYLTLYYIKKLYHRFKRS